MSPYDTMLSKDPNKLDECASLEFRQTGGSSYITTLVEAAHLSLTESIIGLSFI